MRIHMRGDWLFYAIMIIMTIMVGATLDRYAHKILERSRANYVQLDEPNKDYSWNSNFDPTWKD